MSHMQQSQDLESKVLTATPYKLHLMLIEGAVRVSRLAQQMLEQGDTAAADELLLRSIDIVGEMLVSVRGGASEVNQKVVELYLFVFRRLAQAKINEDITALNEALGVLEYERETWQMVCEKEAAQGVGDAETANPKTQRADQQGSAPLRIHTPPTDSANLSVEA